MSSKAVVFAPTETAKAPPQVPMQVIFFFFPLPERVTSSHRSITNSSSVFELSDHASLTNPAYVLFFSLPTLWAFAVNPEGASGGLGGAVTVVSSEPTLFVGSGSFTLTLPTVAWFVTVAKVSGSVLTLIV